MSYELTISKEYEGTRVKNYLKKYIDIPYSALFKFLKNKRITLNGKKIKKDDVLREGDIIKVWLDSIPLREKKENFKDSKNLGLEIIADNEDFFVLNKLPGIVVQGAQDANESLSLHLSYLKKKWKDLGDFEYFHVHRLDKDTSGVLVIAKKRQALRKLNELFRQRGVEKKYVCLCDGEFEQKKGTVEVYLQRNIEGSKEKVSVSSNKTQDSRRTKSNYKVIKEFSYDEGILSLVEVSIETGFMHQIRVHMKYLGHPIICDKMYGNSYVNRKFDSKLSRQFLHASFVSFEYDGKKYEFEAPVSEDLRFFLENLN